MTATGSHRHCEPKFNFWRSNPVNKPYFLNFIAGLLRGALLPLAMTIHFYLALPLNDIVISVKVKYIATEVVKIYLEAPALPFERQFIASFFRFSFICNAIISCGFVILSFSLKLR